MPAIVLAVLVCGLVLALALAVAGIILKRRRGRLLTAATLALVACLSSAAILNAFAAAIPPPRNIPAPLPDSATVYLCSNDATSPNIGDVIAVNARTGATRWRHPLPGTVYDTSPVVANGIVYVRVQQFAGGPAGVLVALDVNDGSERWRVQYATTQIRAVVVDGDTVFINATTIDRTSLVALSAADGSQRWNATVSNLGFAGGASLPIATGGGSVYFTPDGTTLLAVRERDGAILWQTPPNSPGAPLAALRASPDGVVVMDNDGAVTALAASTGSERWRFNTNPTGSYVDSSGLALSDGILFAGATHASPSVSGELYALRVSDGTIVWRHDLSSPIGPLMLDGDTLDVPNGNLTVFRASDGTIIKSLDPGDAAPLAVLSGVLFGYTRAVYHPSYGPFGFVQPSDPHNYLTALPASGDAPYWRVTAPALQGGLIVAT